MKKHLSPSQLRSLLDGYGKVPPCPARVVAIQRMEWGKTPPSDAMQAGSYLDAILTTGKGNEWLKNNPDCLAKTGTNKGKPKKAFAGVLKMAEKFKASPAWDRLKSSDGQVMVNGEINHTPFIGFIDFLNLDNPDITDLKKVDNFNDEWVFFEGRNRLVPWWWKSAEQLVIYQILVKEEFKVYCPAHITGMNKLGMIRDIMIEEQTISHFNRLLDARIERANELKKNPPHCMMCEYCASQLGYSHESGGMPESFIDEWTIGA